jgi:hypothetical protein
MHRTHHCAQLTKADLDATVSLLGWVDTIRDQGGIIFVDLRDRKGVTQISSSRAKMRARRAGETPEAGVGDRHHGQGRAPPAGTENKNLPTGEVEVERFHLEIHNISDTPPFPLDDVGGDKVNEDLRLTYRYLDLRRPKMRKNLQVRHRRQVDPRLFRQPGVHRGRDAGAVQEHARRRARVPRAVAHSRGTILRALAVAAAVQADPHGGGRGAVFPDRPLLPRRGLAGGPADGVHAGGRRGFVRDARGHLRAVRRHAEEALEGRARAGHPDAVPADGVTSMR